MITPTPKSSEKNNFRGDSLHYGCSLLEGILDGRRQAQVDSIERHGYTDLDVALCSAHDFWRIANRCKDAHSDSESLTLTVAGCTLDST